MLLVGQDAVKFNRAFARRGLHETMLRFSPLMEENMLMASGAAATRGLVVAAGYFRSLIDANALDLLGRYTALHGPVAPAIGNAAESCYEGAQLLSTMIQRAGNCLELDGALAGAAYDGPRGTVEFQDREARQCIRLALADGLDFDIIATL
jgi:urea transport system substrate-binding protein